MERREFLKRMSGILASIPVVGFFLRDTNAENIESVDSTTVKPDTIKGLAFYDSITFNEIVQRKCRDTHPNLLFLQRTKIIDCDDEEIVGYGNYQTYVSDLIVENGTVESTGTFGFKGVTIPNIKIGSRVSESIMNRAARVNNEIDKTTTNNILSSYREQLADNLALGLKERMNLQVIGIMLGGLNDSTSGTKILMDVPKEVHISVDWSKPFTAIKEHAEKMANLFGQTFNRMTLSTPAYKRLLSSDEFVQAYKEYRKENAERFEEYINEYRKANNDIEPNEFEILIHFAPTVLNKHVGVFPEVYDACYRLKQDTGGSKRIRYLPENKVLFSNTQNDNNHSVIDYAQGMVMETITASLIKGAPEIESAKFGPIGYFTGNRDLNPPDITAWAVTRGLPRLHDKTAFSSFTI